MTIQTGIRVAFLVLLPLLRTHGADEPVVDSKLYGKAIESGTPKVGLDQALSNPKAFESKRIRIQGTIGPVCQNKGCWMYLTDGANKIRITFENYGFFVPLDSEGRRVEVEGMLDVEVIAKEQLQHWAAEEKDGKPEQIVQDATTVLFVASGVLIEGDMKRPPNTPEATKEGE